MSPLPTEATLTLAGPELMGGTAVPLYGVNDPSWSPPQVPSLGQGAQGSALPRKPAPLTAVEFESSWRRGRACVYVCLKAQPSGRVSGVGMCLRARVTGARLCLGAGRGALRGAGARPPSFYRFPHSRGSRTAFSQLAGPPGRPGPWASPAFPHSSLPGYEEVGAGTPPRHQATLGLEVGAGEGPVFS